jgi:flagellar biosynthesis GTPase FlhF
MSHTTIATGLGTALVASAFALGSGAAFAQTSSANSTDQGVTVNSSATHYQLTDQNNTESLNYDHPRDLRVCNMSGKLAAAGGASDQTDRLKQTPITTRPVPLHTQPTPVELSVRYGGTDHRVPPGQCDRFRAKDVRLSAAQPLPLGSALDVSVEQVGAQQTAEAGDTARHHGANATTTKQLSEQLKEQDETMRQANKELQQSNTRLAEATRKLKQTESTERKAANAERRAASGARQEARQEDGSAQPNSSQSSTGGQQGTPE